MKIFTILLTLVSIFFAYTPSLNAEEYTTAVTVEDILKYGDQLDFSDPRLLAAVAKIESDYQPDVKNHFNGVTYYGLMQISYSTAKMMGFTGHPSDLMNWKVNVKWASVYLKQLLAQHKSVKKAVAAYNAGTVFYCQRKCPKGELVNESYVRGVLAVYKNIPKKAKVVQRKA